MKTITAEFLGFVAVGAINTGVTYAVYLAARSYIHYSIAYTAAFVIGIALSYLLNVLFVFKGRHSINAAVTFPFVYMVQYFYGLIVLSMLVEVFGVSNTIAMLVVIATSVPLTFVLMKRVFASVRPGDTFSARQK
jgi:putative flippase GtrA